MIVPTGMGGGLTAADFDGVTNSEGEGMLLVAAKRCRTGIASLLLYLGLSARVAKKDKVPLNHLGGSPPLHILPVLLPSHPLTILSSHDPTAPPIHPPSLPTGWLGT